MPRNKHLYKKGILSIPDAAKLLHVSYPTMRRIYDEEITEGKFSGRMGKDRRVTATALVTFLKSKNTPVPIELEQMSIEYEKNYSKN